MPSAPSNSAPLDFVPCRWWWESQGFWQTQQPKSQVPSPRPGVRRPATFCLLGTLRRGLQSPNTPHQPGVGGPALICRCVSAGWGCRQGVSRLPRIGGPWAPLARKGVGSNRSEDPYNRLDWFCRGAWHPFMPVKHCRVLAGKQKAVEGRPEGEMERLPQSKPKVAGLHSEEAKGDGCMVLAQETQALASGMPDRVPGWLCRSQSPLQYSRLSHRVHAFPLQSFDYAATSRCHGLPAPTRPRRRQWAPGWSPPRLGRGAQATAVFTV